MIVESEFGSQQRDISDIGPSMRKIDEEEIVIQWDGKKEMGKHGEYILVLF